MIGGQNLVDSVSRAAYRGTLVSVGQSCSGRVRHRCLDAHRLRNNTLRSVWLGGATMFEHERIHALTSDLLQRVAIGELRVEIDRSFSLADAAKAHAYAESRKAFGRVILTP